jgi:hypothetical protein
VEIVEVAEGVESSEATTSPAVESVGQSIKKKATIIIRARVMEASNESYSGIRRVILFWCNLRSTLIEKQATGYFEPAHWGSKRASSQFHNGTN